MPNDTTLTTFGNEALARFRAQGYVDNGTYVEGANHVREILTEADLDAEDPRILEGFLAIMVPVCLLGETEPKYVWEAINEWGACVLQALHELVTDEPGADEVQVPPEDAT